MNENLSKLVNKYVNFYPDIIKQLVERLNLGLPIASIRIIKNKEYEETPTFIQEIFLASWISRIDVLLPEVIHQLKSYQQNDNLIKFYKEYISKPIFRHDQAVLKSIQVSEWFDFYNNGRPRPKNIRVFPKKLVPIKDLVGILVDHEIKNLILEDEIKILPIMNIAKQIGTSSIDIRLGTSFQLFYPDQYGIVDFTEENNNTNSKYFSKKVNLDFIEGITIAPGQFLLGHSMEYIKLPDYICGNLEGRSSFARLGIEIHMTAGFIDPGFEGVLTLEIYNAGPTTVKLYPGLRIGQLRFEKTKIPNKPYGKNNIVKYKGFLEHNLSRQNFDYEVQQIVKWKHYKHSYKN